MDEKCIYSFKQLSDLEKLQIADIVAADTLQTVNQNCKKVLFKETFYTKYGKRILDIILSFFAIILTLPINFFLMIFTYFDVGKPIFFFQKRIGKGLEPFSLGKFRNMTNAKDKNGILLPPQERVTNFGRFVRKNSFDELLNFWYIFIGKMSLIGPRPMPVVYLQRFNNRHIQRHLVRPGLECPLHTENYHGDMTWDNRFENDIWYVENISLKTDIRMAFLLFKDALFSSRKEQRGKAEIGSFIGYFEDGTIIDSENIPKKYYDEMNKLKNES